MLTTNNRLYENGVKKYFQSEGKLDEKKKLIDTTFRLPRDKAVNMDVKFPLIYYENYLIANSEKEKDGEKKKYIRGVREHIKTIGRKDYVNPKQGMVDYVLMLIPNESIYYFVK